MLVLPPRAAISGSVEEARRSLDDADGRRSLDDDGDLVPAAIPHLSGVSELPARYKVHYYVYRLEVSACANSYKAGSSPPQAFL